MKVSYHWLCELIDGLKKITPEELAHKLTMSGLEIEESENLAARYHGIIVGEVVSLEKHPNADKLNVCQVSTGKENIQVVCGAPNVTEGKKYPFATIGTKFDGGFEIKPVKLRGVDSFGMLCSEKELGLSDEHGGLLELNSNLETGSAFAKAMGLDDTILEVNITANRGDALSHWGVARDIAAITGLKTNFDHIVPAHANLEFNKKEESKTDLKITHLDQKSCERFTGSEITGVNIAKSPSWLKYRLETLGIRSINTVVDATNYVLLLTGHPVHAYDANDINGKEIQIYSLTDKQKYKTLDSIERDLLPGDLAIADSKGIVGLAGIMGGENSEIKDDTKNLILEVAFFNPDVIRASSRRLGLQTESSYRFARFVNPDSVLIAHEILRDLILALSGGTPSNITDSYPRVYQRVSIILEDNEIKRILGIAVDKEKVMSIFTGLGCEVSFNDSTYTVNPPIARSDLQRPVDLIEEIARIYGLNNIPATMPLLPMRYAKETKESLVQYAVKDYLVALGFNEMLNYSFSDPVFMKKVLRVENTDNWIKLHNPLSEDLSVMRPSLLPQMLQMYLKNHLLTPKGLRFFELRNVYAYDADKNIVEKNMLGILYVGNVHGRNRFDQNRDADFFEGKGLIESLMKQGLVSYEMSKLSDWPFHPHQSASFAVASEPIARVGALHPELLNELKIREKVHYIEIDFDVFAKLYKQAPAQYKPFSQLPSVYRDLSLVVGKDLSYKDITKIIDDNKPELLSDYEIFDIFEGEKLGPDKKSLTLSMVYEPRGKSLTDEEVNEVHFKLVDTLNEKLGATLR